MRSYKAIYWTLRILAIVFALFLSLFAFDAFEKGFSFETLIGFIIHLMPVYVLVIFIIIAWKREWVGGIGFLTAGIFFMLFFHTYKNLFAFLFISGPAYLIGILFILSHYLKPVEQKTIRKIKKGHARQRR